MTNSDSDCNVEVANLSLQVDQPYKTPTINSLNGAFMSVDKLFKVTTQTPTGDCIPQGVKENVYFVIYDTKNRRGQNKKYSEYPDDCGAWQKGKNSTKSHDFILIGDSLTFIVKKGGEYCKEVKQSFISLDPPSEPSSVVVVKRKYSNHKKRVTWFDMSPKLPVAVVEYISSYPTNTNVHGNAKHINAPYRHTTTLNKKPQSEKV